MTIAEQKDSILTPRVTFSSLGCKVNQSEVQKMTEDLSGLGYRVVPLGQEADVYVINTCAVTHVADRKSRQMIRRIRRAAPKALIIVTGCYAEISAQGNNDGGDLVVGTADKDRIVDLIAKRRPAGKQVSVVEAFEDRCEPQTETSRTRAFVKIQDGCDDYCTYCIVPAARGRPA